MTTLIWFATSWFPSRGQNNKRRWLEPFPICYCITQKDKTGLSCLPLCRNIYEHNGMARLHSENTINLVSVKIILKSVGQLALTSYRIGALPLIGHLCIDFSEEQCKWRSSPACQPLNSAAVRTARQKRVTYGINFWIERDFRYHLLYCYPAFDQAMQHSVGKCYALTC